MSCVASETLVVFCLLSTDLSPNAGGWLADPPRPSSFHPLLPHLSDLQLYIVGYSVAVAPRTPGCSLCQGCFSHSPPLAQLTLSQPQDLDLSASRKLLWTSLGWVSLRCSLSPLAALTCLVTHLLVSPTRLQHLECRHRVCVLASAVSRPVSTARVRALPAPSSVVKWRLFCFGHK